MQLNSLSLIAHNLPRKWNLHKIQSPAKKYSVQEEIESRNVSQINVTFSTLEEQMTEFEEDTIFDTQKFNERLVASLKITADQEMVAESKET